MDGSDGADDNLDDDDLDDDLDDDDPKPRVKNKGDKKSRH